MLNSHMKSHTNVYQYRCSDCTYATKYCHSLKLHLRKYNHKPATVLNQDGSLPQGLDADTSGLSVVTKRGPPRGPRRPRKDKSDPYFSQVYGMSHVPIGMPPGVNPMLKGMMPFWPMLPQAGLPGPQGHPAMLPGMSSLAHHMAGGLGEDMEGPDRYGAENSSGDLNDSYSEESNPIREDDHDEKEEMSLPCRLCDFVGDSVESLHLHLFEEHKDKHVEMAKMYGFSESTLAESVERAKMRNERRASESAIDSSELESESNDFHKRNTIAGLLSRHSSYPGAPIMVGDERRDIPSWASVFSSDPMNRNQGYGDDDMNDEDDLMTEPSREMDILKQMTLKFGDGPVREKKSLLENAGMSEIKEEKDNDDDDNSVLSPKKSHKETPLDLTKPKSVSPPMFSNPSSPKIENGDEEDLKMPWGEDERQVDLSSIAEKLYRKRQLSDQDGKYGSTETPEVPSLVPRKRSRKGKAYKLDTICLKLQERHSGSPIDSDDTESDMDLNFERYQPVRPSSSTSNQDENNMDKDGLKTDITPSSPKKEEQELVKEDERNEENSNIVSPDREGNGDEIVNETELATNVSDEASEEIALSEKTANEEILKDNEEKETEKVNIAEETEKVNIADIKDKTDADNENINDESSNNESKDISKSAIINEQPKRDVDNKPIKSQFSTNESIIEEAEKEFDSLQFTLDIMNKPSEEDPKIALEQNVEQICNEDDDDDKTVENDDFETIINKTKEIEEELSAIEMESSPIDLTPIYNKEVFDLSDKENSNDGLALMDSNVSNPAEGDEIEDKVDLINTVLENRKKPLPPAVRRGTELAWKLLNDPVNPVTSIPIPVQSPPLTPKSQHSSPTAPSGSSGGSRLPSPNHTNTLQSPNRNGFKMGVPHQLPTPPFHHHQVQPPPPPPMIPLKNHLPVPLPPTPMAYIPPTNRMMPEHPMVRLPPTPPKQMPKDMYECTYCDLSFRDCVMYTVHMGYHSNRNPFKCNSCGIVCRDKVEFFLHIARSPHS